MKVRDTSQGRMYAVSSEIGCTAINRAMAIDIPAGGQSVILALDKKIIIDGDDDAKFVEVRWGTNTAVGSRPVPAWLSDVLAGLISIVGEANFDINWVPAENKLYLQFSLEATTEQIDEVQSLLGRVLPNDLVLEMEWENGLPIEYTPLEYIESDGVATMSLPFESKNKSFICWHTLGLPKTTRGLYTYGGTSVSQGYGPRYNSGTQGLAFTGLDAIRNGRFLRGGKYKIGWRVRPHETKNYYFALLYEDEVLTEVQQYFNPYWQNAYNVFSSAQYDSKIGGATYELTIDIEGESVKYVPALNPTGAPCLYCIETRTPYYNDGGDGDFIYPTETTTYSLRRVLPDWGKLTEHGLARLYHTPKDYEGELYDYAIENGYKQIVGAEQPEEGYWNPVWHDREDCIELEWVEVEPPTEEETPIEGIENA